MIQFIKRLIWAIKIAKNKRRVESYCRMGKNTFCVWNGYKVAIGDRNPVKQVSVDELWTPLHPELKEDLLKEDKTLTPGLPVLVTTTNTGGHVILDGRHRLLAAKKANMDTINSFVLTHDQVRECLIEGHKIMEELEAEHRGIV